MAQIYKKTKKGQIEKKTIKKTKTHILLSSLRSNQDVAQIDKKWTNRQILGFPRRNQNIAQVGKKNNT